jgi:hypothetical protein
MSISIIDEAFKMFFGKILKEMVNIAFLIRLVN